MPKNESLNDYQIIIDMPLRYLIREVIINQKYARSQKVSWNDRRTLIKKIIEDMSKNTLFHTRDKGKPNYNLVGYTDQISVCIMPIKDKTHLFEFALFNENESKTKNTNFTIIKSTPLSFICLFNLGLVKHQDINIFDEGKIQNIWRYFKGKDSGRLSSTAFGIIVSNKLEKIFIIKQSDLETATFAPLINYMEKKSANYIQNDSIGNSFKLIPIIEGNEFDINHVESVASLTLGVNSDFIDDYKARVGRTDAFYNLVLSKIPAFFSKGRKSHFEINFSEEGDEEAKEIFKNLYSSFASIQGDEMERIFTEFKALYDDTLRGKIEINFKRDKTYTYQPSSSSGIFADIIDAFMWFSQKLLEAQKETEEDK